MLWIRGANAAAAVVKQFAVYGAALRTRACCVSLGA